MPAGDNINENRTVSGEEIFYKYFVYLKHMGLKTCIQQRLYVRHLLKKASVQIALGVSVYNLTA
jgi:hypothetical protein